MIILERYTIVIVYYKIEKAEHKIKTKSPKNLYGNLGE